MKYIITLVFRSFFQSKFKNIILISCLSLGMVIGIVFVSQANQAKYTYENYVRYTDFNNILVMELNSPLNSIDVSKVQKKFDFITEIYRIRRLFENIVQYNEINILGASIYATDYNFNQIFTQDYPILGKWFDSEEECVIGSKLANRFKISKGDSIIIGINKYVVSGILGIEKYNDSIFLSDLNAKKDNLSQEFYLLCNEISEKSLTELNEFIAKKKINFSLFSGEILLKNEYNRLFKGWTPTIVISTLSLLYGIVNIINIEKFYFIKRKIFYGVLMAYGATKQHIFFSIYLENGVFSFISSFITFFIVYFFQFTPINNVISMRVDGVILFIIICISQVYSLLYSVFLLRKLIKRQIAEVFRSKI